MDLRCSNGIYFSFLILLSSLEATRGAATYYKGVTYTVINEAYQISIGGERFEKKIGLFTCLNIMKVATNKTWEILNQTNREERRPIRVINLIIISGSTSPLLSIPEGEIRISDKYIEKIPEEVLLREFTGCLYEWVSFWWQWHGNNAPDFLIHGIAGFVRIKAWYPAMYWKEKGNIDDNGVVAYFLWYCNDVRGNGTFVARLNKMLKDVPYSGQIWIELLGATFEDLWEEYNAPR